MAGSDPVPAMDGGTGAAAAVPLVVAMLPALPDAGWDHMQADAINKPPNLSATAALDVFIAGKDVSANKSDMLVEFIQLLPAHVNNSQLLHAQMAYIYFKHGGACPLLYDTDLEVWFHWHNYWQKSGGPLMKIRSHFQAKFLDVMRNV